MINKQSIGILGAVTVLGLLLMPQISLADDRYIGCPSSIAGYQLDTSHRNGEVLWAFDAFGKNPSAYCEYRDSDDKPAIHISLNWDEVISDAEIWYRCGNRDEHLTSINYRVVTASNDHNVMKSRYDKDSFTLVSLNNLLIVRLEFKSKKENKKKRRPIWVNLSVSLMRSNLWRAYDCQKKLPGGVKSTTVDNAQKSANAQPNLIKPEPRTDSVEEILKRLRESQSK